MAASFEVFRDVCDRLDSVMPNQHVVSQELTTHFPEASSL